MSADFVSDDPTGGDRGSVNPSAKQEVAANLPISISAMSVDLATLHDDDVRAEARFRDGVYARLVPTYREGLRLMLDEDARIALFSDPYWKEHVGERPKPGQHGPEDALPFAIRRVFGGLNRERNQRASMLVRACQELVSRNVAPEDLVNELKRKSDGGRGSGLKAAARFKASRDRAEGRNRPHRASKVRRDGHVHASDRLTDAAPQIIEADFTEVDTGALGEVLGGGLPEGRVDASSRRHTIEVVCVNIEPDALPDKLYLLCDGDLVVLSGHPDELLEVRVPAQRL